MTKTIIKKMEIYRKQWESLSIKKTLKGEKALEAVKNDADALRYVKEQSEAVCLEAVKRNGDALQYVEETIFYRRMTEPKKPYATFLGYQEDTEPDKPFPIFNVWDSVMDGGTVTKETLKWKGIPIPEYPIYQEWLKKKAIKENNHV